MIIIDGQQRTSAIRSRLKSLRTLPAYRQRMTGSMRPIATDDRV
jgi:hypothetical protein